MAFSFMSAFVMGVFMCITAPVFPAIYNTTDEVRSIAAGLLRIVGLAAPIHSFCNASYFTLRSGGKTWITFMFDAGYLWVISIPLARILSIHTVWPILLVYAICEFIDITKALMGGIMIKKGVWINNIVAEKIK